jgi:hypothetical protein
VDPDPHQNNADPQPWAQLSKDCCLIYNYLCLGKQTCIFFLLPTASSFLITSLSHAHGDAHGRGGDAQGGEGGCTCILCFPPGYAPGLVADLPHFNADPDPDPAFHSNADPDPDPAS